jgi:hypothetical protein
VNLDPVEQNLITETIVGAQDMNLWSILMPALYQLVPGSMIAKLWFTYIFPPVLLEQRERIEGTQYYYTTYSIDASANNVFAGLMIISTSLALGVLIGFASVQIVEHTARVFPCFTENRLKSEEKLERARSRRCGMYSVPSVKEDDPDSVIEDLRKAILGGIKTEEEADRLFDAIDIDQSNSVDEEEVTYYMVKAGLEEGQIKKLFASMDKDGNGEVSREEFRRALIDNNVDSNLLKLMKEIEQESPIIEQGDTEIENRGGKDVDTS